MKILFLIFTILFSVASNQNIIKILFVGNSLTYTNDLPLLVEQQARLNGLAVEADMLAYPNYALIDHWQDGEMQKQIQSGQYDYVIVQQGPSSQKEGRGLLLASGQKISELCIQSNCQLAFFMVWPSQTYYHTFSGVIMSYQEAAQITNSLLIPVGDKWKLHFDATGDYAYYGPDGFHPSLKGSQVAAKIIVETIADDLQ